MWALPAPPFVLFVVTLCCFHCSEFLLAYKFDRINVGWHCELIGRWCAPEPAAAPLPAGRLPDPPLCPPLPVHKPGCLAGPTAPPCWWRA